MKPCMENYLAKLLKTGIQVLDKETEKLPEKIKAFERKKREVEKEIKQGVRKTRGLKL